MGTAVTPVQSIVDPNVAASYYETPFVYAKTIIQAYLDASPPTGPTGAYIDVVRSQGDSDFFARRALHCLNFQDMNSQQFITALGNQPIGTFYGLDMPLAPEKLFVLGADIPFILQQTSGLINTGIAFLTFPGGSQADVAVASVVFQGIKRFKGAPNNQPSYPFYEKPYTYVQPFTQDWTYLEPPYTTLVAAAPQTFIKVVNNYDFELQALEFGADFNNNNTGQTSYNGYMVKLYDANGYALMSDWVHCRDLSYNGGYAGVIKAATPGDALPWFPNCFPVPPLIYPKGSQIRIDILSLLDTATTGGGSSIDQLIHYRGVNRIPC